MTNFTSGQGLVLMKEVLYTISGKRLPVVFNIGARALTSQGAQRARRARRRDERRRRRLGHAVRPQRPGGRRPVPDRPPRRRGDRRRRSSTCRTASSRRTPSRSVRLPELEFMKEFIGKPEDKLMNLMDPANPIMSGVVQNQDSYMKGKIAQRWYYDRWRRRWPRRSRSSTDKTGRRYDFVEPYRCEDAEYIIVGMGCYMETAQATVDYLREKGVKAGCLNVYCFRPFPARQIVARLKNCMAFSVLERMDDPLSTTGNHLTREIKAAFCDALTGQNGLEKIDRIPRIYSGCGGLGSRDVRPGDIIAIFDNMIDDGQDYFCVGIDHPLALKVTDDPDLRPPGAFSMRGHSVGGFGSVTTNKVIATIAGQVFGKDVQAYPKYGSEKKGLPTTYYLTIADSHIFTHSELEHVDLVVLNDTNALFSGNPLDGHGRRRGDLHADPVHQPGRRVGADSRCSTSSTIREKQIRVYFADMVKIAREVASVADLRDAHAGHRAARRRS